MTHDLDPHDPLHIRLEQLRETLTPDVGERLLFRVRSALDADRSGSRMRVPERKGYWPRITLAVLMGGSALLFGLLVMRHGVSRLSPRDQTLRQHATTVGQVGHITLSDGSQITLAPRSIVGVSSDPRAARTITLQGEAYFNVRAGPLPFVVRTGAVTTRVLGTAFNIRAYPHQAHIRVAVHQGRVAVTPARVPQGTLTLAAGAVGDVTDSSAHLVATDAADQDDAWRDGRLVFHRTPAREVFAALTRWYGYEFQITDSVLAEQRLTAVVTTRSSQAALATIKLLLDAELTFEGKIVMVRPRATRPVRERRDGSDAFSYTHTEMGR